MKNYLTQSFLDHAQVEIPLICGPMYPCSNPELVAAVSEAGGLGVVQPISLVFVHGYAFREGIQKIRSLTKKPVGLNIMVEKGVGDFFRRAVDWLDVALDEGVRFFITSLGDPRWVVEKVKRAGGIVYHDVTERRFAEKAVAAGVDGLILVNKAAGGHAGSLPPKELLSIMQEFGLPLVAAGGISTALGFKEELDAGHAAVQMGTRFIATHECSAGDAYKQAIVDAKAQDIVMTEKLSGVPAAVINTPYVKRVGTDVNPIEKFLLKDRNLKHLARMAYSAASLFSLKRSITKDNPYENYFQAGRSVEGIDAVESVAAVMGRFRQAIGG